MEEVIEQQGRQIVHRHQSGQIEDSDSGEEEEDDRDDEIK
jgi:hypothetical protein